MEVTEREEEKWDRGSKEKSGEKLNVNSQLIIQKKKKIHIRIKNMSEYVNCTAESCLLLCIVMTEEKERRNQSRGEHQEYEY